MHTETTRSSEGSNGRGPGMNVEVRERPERRRFRAKYKLRILRAAAAAKDFGAIAALLRREGLYSSHLTRWRAQCERGGLKEFSQARGRKAQVRNPLAGEVAQLQSEIARLAHKLAQAELIIDVQKKLCAMLNIPLSRSDNDGSNA